MPRHDPDGESRASGHQQDRDFHLSLSAVCPRAHLPLPGPQFPPCEVGRTAVTTLDT